MRISDWSSDVCSSDLLVGGIFFVLTANLAVLALLPVPMIVFGAFWFQRRLAPRYARMREAAGTLSARLANNLGGMATIQAYTAERRSEEHTSELQSLMRISYAVFCLKKKIKKH